MRVRCKSVPGHVAWFVQDAVYNCEEKTGSGTTIYFVKVELAGDESLSVVEMGEEFTIPTPPVGAYDVKLDSEQFNEIFEVVG